MHFTLSTTNDRSTIHYRIHFGFTLSRIPIDFNELFVVLYLLVITIMPVSVSPSLMSCIVLANGSSHCLLTRTTVAILHACNVSRVTPGLFSRGNLSPVHVD